jgi:histidinol-phosphate/aromatic aminotransferase/cobyric acid decarboxylase-like protein
MNILEENFNNDDYEELNIKYFKILREKKNMAADPSGWIDTYSNVGNVYGDFGEKLQGYHTDISNQLDNKKKPIVNLLSEWDCFSYSQNNITLCHSATVGSVIVMGFLISRGIKTIICETPNYFATYDQAQRMGLKMIRVPTYYNSNFKLDISQTVLEQNKPCAVWLTQPRTALGLNQNAEDLKSLIKTLSAKDFLIIDEATEQFFPSVLHSLNPKDYPQVIKIRSMFKGLGINGIRLAYISHHESLRIEIANEMEIFLGALDVYSIEHAVEMSKDIPRFKILLSVANEQVVTLRERAEKLLNGTNCEVSKMENGYIGSAIVKFKPSKLSQKEKRQRFIEYCSKEKMPVILGSAMGFANHTDTEFVRLNYFNRDYNILEGLKIISRFDL